nr:hypothetical protein CFP56_07642 [Quercus suber]
MSQTRNSPRKKKSDVPPSGQRITAFFKPYGVPKDKTPSNDVAEDEIVLARPCAALRDDLGLQQDDGATVSGIPPSSRSMLTSLATSPARTSPTRIAIARTSTVVDVGEPGTDANPSPEASGSGSECRVAVVSANTQVAAPPSIRRTTQPALNSTANTSFSSISTLTTLSSQASSRRVMKDGEMAITNSDSDDPDDSSDELADILSLVPRKRIRLTPPTSEMKHSAGCDRMKDGARMERSRHSSQNTRSIKTSPRLLSPPRTVYKHSLKNMIKQSKEAQASQVRIANAEAAVHAAESRRTELADMDLGRDDSLRLAAAAATDGEEGERVIQAMGRMEATMQEETFHYFTGNTSILTDFPFPVSDLPDSLWAKLLSKRHAREHACLTGFVADLASQNRLPAAVIEWFAAQLALEPREDLCEAYIGVLQAASESTHKLMSLTSLAAFYQTQFSSIRATSQQSSAIHLEARKNHDPEDNNLTGLPHGLGYVIRGLEYLVPMAGMSAVSKAVADLALVNVDARIKADSALQSTVQNTMVALLDHVDDSYTFVRDHLQTNPKLSLSLQCQIVTAFPAASICAHTLRRRLALFCITQSSNDLPPSSEEWQIPILEHLQHATEFAIDSSTDYVLLKLLAQVLDVAIDTGFSDRRTWLDHTTNSSKEPQKVLFSTSLREAATTTGSAQKRFNDEIDALTNQLATMQNHIKDGGMSHLLRMEAKSALNALELRLKSSVRTKPRPIKAVFGTRTSSASLTVQSAVIDAFLSRNNAGTSTRSKSPMERSPVSPAKDNGTRSKHKGVRFVVKEDWSGSDDESLPGSRSGEQEERSSDDAHESSLSLDADIQTSNSICSVA